MRLPLIGQNRPSFIEVLGPFWIYFDRFIANASYAQAHTVMLATMRFLLFGQDPN